MYLRRGERPGDDRGDWTADGRPGGRHYFGNSVATAGDVNGDGYADVVVGAHRLQRGEHRAGRTCIWGARAAWRRRRRRPLTGEAGGDDFGCSVATAGDVNGDGYADVMVGAYGYSSGTTGRAYVYLGGAERPGDDAGDDR